MESQELDRKPKAAEESIDAPRKTGPTMMDVARHAGVSQATVSLILNGNAGARFSAGTRNRVKRIAAELGYTLVRRGKRQTSQAQAVLAFVADEIATDPWMTLAFDGAREAALEHGYAACLSVSRGDLEADVTGLEMAGNRQILGVIYGTILTRRVELSAQLLKYPTVLVNCYTADRSLPAILPGDLLGGRTATETLIRAGRRRIAMINGQQGVDATRERLKGYRQALASHDLPYDDDLVHPGNWEPSSGYEITRKLMALPNPPDGIFCANDMMAMGCYDALRELGLRIPDDVSVVGFDDREIAQFLRPALTTLVLPHREMGALAAETLIDMVGGLRGGHHQIKVECPLVERRSV